MTKAYDADLSVGTPSSDSKLEAMTSGSQDPAALAPAEAGSSSTGVRGSSGGRGGPARAQRTVLVTAENSPEPGVGCCL